VREGEDKEPFRFASTLRPASLPLRKPRGTRYTLTSTFVLSHFRSSLLFQFLSLRRRRDDKTRHRGSCIKRKFVTLNEILLLHTSEIVRRDTIFNVQSCFAYCITFPRHSLDFPSILWIDGFDHLFTRPFLCLINSQLGDSRADLCERQDIYIYIYIYIYMYVCYTHKYKYKTLFIYFVK